MSDHFKTCHCPQTACDDCSSLGANLFSRGGVRCEKCPPGQQPNSDRTACESCDAGSYSSDGACEPCEAIMDVADNPFVAGSGATRCTRCSPGRGPFPLASTQLVNADSNPVIVLNRTECADCADGFHSSDGVCRPCAAGSQATSAGTSCVLCDEVNPATFSPNGTTCRRCPHGEQPVAAGSGCEPCPGDTLSNALGGLCLDACDALGCSDRSMFIPQRADAFKMTSIDEICTGATAWVDAGAGTRVSVSPQEGGPEWVAGVCTDNECTLQAAEGALPIRITGETESGQGTQTCDVDLTFIASRVSVEPNIVSTAAPLTGFTDETVAVVNTGGQDSTVFSVVVDQAWVAVEEITNNVSVSVELPQKLLPGEALNLTLRASGTTSGGTGSHSTNCTVVSSSGESSFLVNFEVLPESLRVVTLPDRLPPVTLRAGSSSSTAITICAFRHLTSILSVRLSAARFAVSPPPPPANRQFSSGAGRMGDRGQLHQLSWACARQPATR